MAADGAMRSAANDELAALLRQFGVKVGDPGQCDRAQRAFYDRLRDELEYCARYVVNNNRELAIVAMQEAWIRIFANAHAYDPARASVRTWAKMITARCACDALRAHYRVQRRLAGLDGDEDEVTSEAAMAELADAPALDPDQHACPLPHPDSHAYAGQLERAVTACLDGLASERGPNFQLTMVLALDGDFSYAQMHEILAADAPRHRHINLEQVSGWLRQAKAKMQRCLGQKLGWGIAR